MGETLRATLNALAVVAPDWLSNLVENDWFDRYSKPVEESRLPKGTEARNDYAETIGRDGMRILEAIYDEPTAPLWLREIPVIETLRITWIQQYWINNGHDERVPLPRTRSWVNPEHGAGQASCADMRSGILMRSGTL